MIKIRQLKINVLDDSEKTLKFFISKKLGICFSDIKNVVVKKRSLDARKKPLIYYIYEVNVEVLNEEIVLEKNKSNDVLYCEEKKYEIKKSSEVCEPVYIVGAGPAGLLCAYTLLLSGIKVVLIERGKCIKQRVLDVERFWETGKLDVDSNIQFGEGGAGTFSDGKLNTLIKDKEKRCEFLFHTFVKFGAPSEIIYDYKPHIGTDNLRVVITNLIEEIKSLGGEILYNTTLTNIYCEKNIICSIEVNNEKKINVKNLVLAIGHSARDTYKMLYDNNVILESKPFAVGLRIMHDQKHINKSQIGVYNHDKLLEQSYKLTCSTKNKRGVYSFCMCPGGYVVNSSSEKDGCVVNGMSNYNRESGVANSAIVVSVNIDDYGFDIFSGIEFQKDIEKKCFNLANGKVPLQYYKDFKLNKKSEKIDDSLIKLKGEYEFSNLRCILPNEINEALIDGIDAFGKKIKGFNNDDVLLAGVESRTSSPIRIIRNDEFMSNIKGVYPIGEGAGYAGGITSSAIDGIKVAEKIIEVEYCKKNK